MKASMKKKRGVVGAAVLAGILSVGGYALTNTITFEEARSQAGVGSQEITRVKVTDTDYLLGDTTDPASPATTGDMSKVKAIWFEISPAVVSGNADAHAWLNYDGGTTWADCGAIADAATQVKCVFTAPIDIADVGEDPTTRTTQVLGTPGVPGSTAVPGTAKPLKLVIAE